jgi:hypothetical protein
MLDVGATVGTRVVAVCNVEGGAYVEGTVGATVVGGGMVHENIVLYWFGVAVCVSGRSDAIHQNVIGVPHGFNTLKLHTAHVISFV